MKKTAQLALVGALLSMASPAFAAEDCSKLSASVKEAVTSQPTEVLQLVEKRIAANPGCACEIVKAAIEASKADAALVASIVETASTAAPAQMRLIAQCAVAVAPDSLDKVQGVMAKLDPSSGDGGRSAKSSKDAKAPAEVAPEWNPLNLPGQGPIGAGGYPTAPPGPPQGIPPVLNPNPSTETGFILYLPPVG